MHASIAVCSIGAVCPLLRSLGFKAMVSSWEVNPNPNQSVSDTSVQVDHNRLAARTQFNRSGVLPAKPLHSSVNTQNPQTHQPPARTTRAEAGKVIRQNCVAKHGFFNASCSHDKTITSMDSRPHKNVLCELSFKTHLMEPDARTQSKYKLNEATCMRYTLALAIFKVRFPWIGPP